jgi:beta-lactamase class D
MIPNSLIALEEGVIKDTNQVIKMGRHEWQTAWNQDLTLKNAMKYSCIWVFLDLQYRLGLKKYQDYVDPLTLE